jgi:hypothetical protein
MRAHELMVSEQKLVERRQPLTEMAFSRQRIIRALESFERTIPEHAVKIIVLPRSHDVPHWKRELLAWAGYLAKLRLKGSLDPMGSKLAYQYLYDGPFSGNEIGMTEHFIRMAEVSHKIDLKSADPREVHDILKEFLTDLSIAIGQGKDVEAAINSL